MHADAAMSTVYDPDGQFSHADAPSVGPYFGVQHWVHTVAAPMLSG